MASVPVVVRLRSSELGLTTALIPAAVLGAGLERATGLTWQAVPGLVLVLLAGYAISRRRIDPSKHGIDRWSALSAAALAIVSSLAVWYQLHEQGTFTFVRMSLPAIILIAGANACFEEALWRGAVLRTLTQLRIAPGIAVTVQAISFGIAHVVQGYPSGIIGGTSAVVFGIVLGLLVVRTRSLLLPICVHMAVDITIFWTLFGR